MIIYEPKGKAREYSPLACNLYSGCNHGCLYCYAPIIRFKSRDEYLKIIPRENIVELFKREVEKISKTNKQILFCFMTDPYNSAEKTLRLTRRALEIGLNKIPVAVLTKAGKACLNDIDLYKKYKNHIQIGATLTFCNPQYSLEWEPYAALPQDRLETLKILHDEGIRTWASFEPVISPDQSLELIKECLPFVDYFKIGKLNNYKGLDKKIDWALFLKKALEILRPENKNFYIKKDLREAANIELKETEKNYDLYNVCGW